MAQSPIRYKRLIRALPKHNYKVTPSAIEAGFSKNTAEKQQKRLLNSALKHEAKELVATLENKPINSSEAKRTMAEIVGLSREEVMNQLKFIALQARDLHSALKVLAPLAKEQGVILQEEDKGNVTVPILNVTVKEKAQPSHVIEAP